MAIEPPGPSLLIIIGNCNHASCCSACWHPNCISTVILQLSFPISTMCCLLYHVILLLLWNEFVVLWYVSHYRVFFPINCWFFNLFSSSCLQPTQMSSDNAPPTSNIPPKLPRGPHNGLTQTERLALSLRNWEKAQAMHANIDKVWSDIDNAAVEIGEKYSKTVRSVQQAIGSGAAISSHQHSKTNSWCAYLHGITKEHHEEGSLGGERFHTSTHIPWNLLCTKMASNPCPTCPTVPRSTMSLWHRQSLMNMLSSLKPTSLQPIWGSGSLPSPR